jgi:hypothetical protein
MRTVRKGILVTKKGTREGYFPIFIDDREFVHFSSGRSYGAMETA